MGKSISQKIREASGKTKTTKAKAPRKEKLRAKKVKAAKTTKPKTPKFAVTPEFKAEAEKRYDAIKENYGDVEHGYRSFQTRLVEFREGKFHKGITDPETKKPYTRFELCMIPLFGKSASTIFAHLRTARKLLPVIGAADLEKISQENQQNILLLPPTLQGEDKVIKAAQTLTSEKFQEKFPQSRKKQTPEVKKAVAQREGRSVEFKINVSPELLAEFVKAETIGHVMFAEDITDGDRSDTLRAKIWQGILADFNSTNEHLLAQAEETEERETVPAF